MPIIWKFSKIRYLIILISPHHDYNYYTTLIRPHLEYDAATLFNTSVKNCKILETMQNRCLRIIAQAKRRTPSSALQKTLNIPALENRRKYYYLCELYNVPPKAPVTQYNFRSSVSSNLYNSTIEQKRRPTRVRLFRSTDMQHTTRLHKNIPVLLHLQKSAQKTPINLPVSA